MKNNKREIKINESNNLETLLRIIQQDTLLWEYINHACPVNAERMQLLLEIILGIGCREKEEQAGQIYRYGSMLKEQDLLARQMFLWLLSFLDETM